MHSGNLSSVQKQIRDGSEDINEISFWEKSKMDMFSKLYKQFQSPSKANATCPPYNISPPIPTELFTNLN